METKKQIHQRLIKQQKELKENNKVLNLNFEKNKNFATLCNDWLMVFKKPSVAPRTFEGAISFFKNHIKPALGSYNINEITPAIVQKTINNMLDIGYSIATCKKVKFTINQFFEYAKDNDWVKENPTEKVRIRNKDIKNFAREKYKAIPTEIRQKFLRVLRKNHFLKTTCMLAMFGGLRIGEILALKWQDINFESNFISVNHSITQLAKFDNKGKVLSKSTIIGHTKTSASVREVPMPDILKKTLLEWKRHKSKLKEPMKEDYLFCNHDGSLKSYSSTRHELNSFLKKHNLHIYGIQFHTLRHTYSTMLFESGENPKIIQALLGHKSVSTTLTIYNSIDKTYFTQATNRINSLFSSQNLKRPTQKKLTPTITPELQIEVLEKILETLKEKVNIAN